MFYPATASNQIVLPDIVQVNTRIPALQPNEFLTGPFLEGVGEGNILYAITTQTASVELARIGPSGALPPLSGAVLHSTLERDLLDRIPVHKRDRAQFLSTNEGITVIFSGNGMIYAFIRHFHEVRTIDPETGELDESATGVDGNFMGNGPIVNDPGGTQCDFSAPAEEGPGLPKWPVLLSSNRMYVPTVVQASGWLPHSAGNFCATTSYVQNADFTLELTRNIEFGNAGPAEDVSSSIVRSTDGFDPVPPAALRRTEDFSMTDAVSGDVFGPPYPFSNDFYVARTTAGGASAVWLGNRRPNFTRSLQIDLFGGGAAKADLEGPYTPPPAPDAARVLALSGIVKDIGTTAQVLQTADRFVLMSWTEQGTAKWGTFKYAIFGQVTSPFGTLPANLKVRARHIRDGVGVYFELDDLIYPFSKVDKKNPDIEIPVKIDGTFAQVGVLAGEYKLTLVVGEQEIPLTVTYSTQKYEPVTLPLLTDVGVQPDQTFVSSTSGILVNPSNGNLLLLATDLVLPPANTAAVGATSPVISIADAEGLLDRNGITPDSGSVAIVNSTPQSVTVAWTDNGAVRTATFTNDPAVLEATGILVKNGITPDAGSVQIVSATGDLLTLAWTENGVGKENIFSTTQTYAQIEDLLRSKGANPVEGSVRILGESGGNLILTWTDAESGAPRQEAVGVPSPAVCSPADPALSFRRSFNSLDSLNDLNIFLEELAGAPEHEKVPRPLGRGWTHNFNMMILNADTAYWTAIEDMSQIPDTFVILADEDGRPHTFILPWPPVRETLSGEGGRAAEISPERGGGFRSGIITQQVVDGAPPMRLIKTGPKRFELDTKEGVTYIFDVLGKNGRIARLTEIVKRAVAGGFGAKGSFLLDYDPSGRLISVGCHGAKNNFIFTYQPGTNLIASVRDPAGRVFRYFYELGVVESLEDTSRLALVLPPKGDAFEYFYDDELRLSRIKEGGHVVDVQYDAFNRAVKIAPPINANTFDYPPEVAGGQTTYTTKVADGHGVPTTYTFSSWNYGAGGLPIGSGRVESEVDAFDNATLYQRNPGGNIIRMMESNGHLVSAEYDNNENIILRTASKPVKVTYPDDLDKFDPRRNLPTKIEGLAPSALNITRDDVGRITRSEQAGLVTEITRTPDGAVTAVADPASGVTRVEYDGANLSKIISPTATTEFAYGSQSALRAEALGLPDRVSVTPDVGPVSTTQVVYDGLGRPTEMKNIGVDLGDKTADLATRLTRDGRGNVTSVILPTGQTINYEYTDGDQLAAVSSQVTGRSVVRSEIQYDAVGREILRRDANGNIVQNRYDAVGRLTEILRGSDADPDAPAQKTSFGYNSVGNVTRVEHGDGEKESTEYSLEGLPTRQTIESPGLPAQTTATTYNEFKLPTSIQTSSSATGDPSLSVDATYDDLNRPTRQSTTTGGQTFTQSTAYDPTKGLVTEVSSGDYSTRLSYDAAGRANRVVDQAASSGVSIVTNLTLDGYGNVTKIGNEGGRPPVEVTYNSLGQPLSTKQGHYSSGMTYNKSGAVTQVTDNIGNSLKRTVDEEGQPLVEELNGHVTRFKHDHAGNVKERTDPDGSVHEFSYNQHNDVSAMNTPDVDLGNGARVNVTRNFSYNDHGMPATTTTGTGKTQKFEWSGGNLLSQTDEEGRVWKSSRDAFGNLTRLEVDGRLLRVFENDGLGNRKAEVEPDGRRTTYRQDSRGNVVEKTEADGTVTKFKHDPAGNVVEREPRLPNGQTRVEKWEYAGGELLKRMITPEGEINYSYDQDGNLAGIRTNGALTAQLEYKTDVAGRIIEIRGPGGLLISYTYDPEGRVTSVTDGAGRKTTIDYDLKGREKTRVLPNGETIEKDYNGLDWMLKQTHTIRGKVFVRTWGYDADGRVIAYTEDGKKFTYGYDRSGRLVSDTRPDGIVIDYTFDSAGNMQTAEISKIKESGKEKEKRELIERTAFFYNASNQLLRRETLRTKGKDDGRGEHKGQIRAFEYEHDPRGNVIAIRPVKHAFQQDRRGSSDGKNKSGKDGDDDDEDDRGKKTKAEPLTLLWDGAGRLIGATRGSQRTEYINDPEGRLISRKIFESGRLTDERKFLWDIPSENIVCELNNFNQVVATYVPTRTQDDVIVKQNLTLNKTGIYSDFALNLPTREVRDEFGNGIETLEVREPYGSDVTPSSIDHTRFEGKIIDPVTGWAYYRTRWYDPQARRFVSQDQTPIDEFQPDKIHRYAAFGLNPISNVDPMGADHWMLQYYTLRHAANLGNLDAELTDYQITEMRLERLELKSELARPGLGDCTPWKNWITAKNTELKNFQHHWWGWWKIGSNFGVPPPENKIADPEWSARGDFLWVPEYLNCHPNDIYRATEVGIEEDFWGTLAIESAVGAGAAYGLSIAGGAPGALTGVSVVGTVALNTAVKISGRVVAARLGRKTGETFFTKLGRGAHTAIQKKFITNNPIWKAEVKAKSIDPNLRGFRVDLYNPNLKKIIEIKPNTPTGRAAALRRQRFLERQLGPGYKVEFQYYNPGDFLFGP